MSKAEDLAKQLYPDPRMEDYDDILVYRADRDNASMGRINVVRVYEQAEKDLALTPEDIRKIVVLFSEVSFECFDTKSANEMCEETLTRFKQYKEASHD